MTMLPAASDFTGSSITEAQFKTAITSLRTFIADLLGTDSSVPIEAFPSGTKMLFQQTSAPTGWTKDTTHNDKALRVVSGTASSGGSVAFSTVFGKTATDSHTLTTAEIPSHTHSVPGSTGTSLSSWTASLTNQVADSSITSGSAGSGGGHTHGMDIRVQYVDLILAAKD